MIVQFGERELRDGVLGWTSSPVTDPNRRGVLTLAGDALLENPVDFAATCRVSLLSDDESVEPDFTGVVFSAELSNGMLKMELRTPAQQISEHQMRGMVIGSGTPSLPLLWSFMRIAGVPEDQIRTEGIALPLPAPFEVAVPIDGVHLEAPLIVADVTFTNDPMIARSVEDLLVEKSRPIIKQFQEAEAWAWLTVQASTLDAAERMGLDAIDAALDWLLLGARYSFSIAPDRRPLGFARPSNLLPSPHRRDIVHVRSMRATGRWLRGTAWTLSRPRLQASALRDLAPRACRTEQNDGSLRRAIAAWRRAAQSEQPFGRVSALWQALELYAATTSIEPLFSQAELQTMRDRMSGGFSEVQQERINQAVNQLNNPPFLARLRSTIDADGVPLSPEEFGVLHRLRKTRNDIEHGKLPTAPQADDLDHAVGIVGRLLLHASVARAVDPRERAAAGDSANSTPGRQGC